MTKLRVAIHGKTELQDEDFALEALDIATALTIADINVGRGGAEIWDGEHRLARLSKHGGVHATFWRLN
ncbi:hypothetical protein [Qipengyuania qiaonensis]|uniref:ParB/Sulfiredoxin domain-containing protein n=1 Tax=Qipengyuania qiaonensis TaxID=2867240 RepID=A0ABS7JA45_9SPHN|nr:hypothetical protein [Qipengyuania qiaonensis]MBX7483166.1 hypothetical protein [Qipengyuania qiaonensis]